MHNDPSPRRTTPELATVDSAAALTIEASGGAPPHGKTVEEGVRAGLHRGDGYERGDRRHRHSADAGDLHCQHPPTAELAGQGAGVDDPDRNRQQCHAARDRRAHCGGNVGRRRSRPLPRRASRRQQLVERVADQLRHRCSRLRTEVNAIGREPPCWQPRTARCPIGKHQLGIGSAAQQGVAFLVTTDVTRRPRLTVGEPDDVSDPLKAGFADDRVDSSVDSDRSHGLVVVPRGNDQNTVELTSRARST